MHNPKIRLRQYTIITIRTASTYIKTFSYNLRCKDDKNYSALFSRILPSNFFFLLWEHLVVFWQFPLFSHVGINVQNSSQTPPAHENKTSGSLPLCDFTLHLQSNLRLSGTEHTYSYFILRHFEVFRSIPLLFTLNVDLFLSLYSQVTRFSVKFNQLPTYGIFFTFWGFPFYSSYYLSEQFFYTFTTHSTFVIMTQWLRLLHYLLDVT